MFAFALWDARERRLFIARDRVGVKPLYYAWDGTTLVFASEIKALLMHPEIKARPNLPAIAEYMSAMYSVGQHTWFEGISRLLPGHYVRSARAVRVAPMVDCPASRIRPARTLSNIMWQRRAASWKFCAHSVAL